MTVTKRRALGQHFLRDQTTARAIVDLVAPTERDLVVEIGPGDGALTSLLAGRAGRVTALEIDRPLAAALRARMPAVEVLDADARTWDYAGLAAPEGGRVLILGNLPYSVGKPILMALIEARAAIHEMALMLQLEVAERVAAPPGGKTYGSLSIFTQLYCDVRPGVPRPAGRVPPAAEGRLGGPPSARAARAAGSAGRPTPLRERRSGGIRPAPEDAGERARGQGLGLPLDVVRRSAAAAGVDPTRRAETLTLSEFAALATGLP
jgi:16S rRNA (adenine1518-N6/adenine1519-N6)-dimethyltransferase